MLPLPLAVLVVTAMVMPFILVVHLLFLDALWFLTLFLVPIAAGHLLRQVCGSSRDKVWFTGGGVCGSLLKNLGVTTSQLLVPVTLVKDVRLVIGGC